jgi:GPH family glycoside/pentoside/hexuronide:cation symporter
MAETAEVKEKKSIFESPLLSTKIKSANVKLIPEVGFGYLLGPMLAMIANAIVNTFLIQYWDKVLGLSEWAPLFQTLLPIISAILIVIGNLAVGRLMNRKPTVAGKARPLILLGLPLIAVSLLLLFLVPFPWGATKANPSIVALIMVAVGYNLYYALAWPFYYTAHSSLVNLSTRDGTSRSLLATAANAAQLGAIGLASMIGPFLVDLLNLLPQVGLNANGVAVTDDYGKLLEGHAKSEIVSYVNASEQARSEANSKWFIIMIVMIVALVIGCLIEYYFTRERITEENVKKDAKKEGKKKASSAKKVSMGEQAKICTHDKYWWFIILFYFFYQFGGMMKNNSGTFYSQAFTGGTSLSGLINTVGALPTALGMLAIWPLARKFGKANCIKVGAVFAFLLGCIGFLVLIPSIESNSGAVYGISVAAFCLKALGTVPAMYISMALMSNVLEHEEAVHGIRTDGFTMAVYGSIMVAMPGVANGIIVGLKSAFPAEAQKTLMTFLFFGGESLCYLIIAVMFLFMNVEKFSKFDVEAIEADRRMEAEESGKTYVSPAEEMKKQEEESKRLTEENRKADLKARCEKKGLNYEDEEAKYEKARAEKAKAAAEKKAAKEKAKAEKVKPLTPEQEAKKAEKAKKSAERDARVKAEFIAIREAAAAKEGRKIATI